MARQTENSKWAGAHRVTPAVKKRYTQPKLKPLCILGDGSPESKRLAARICRKLQDELEARARKRIHA